MIVSTGLHCCTIFSLSNGGLSVNLESLFHGDLIEEVS